MDCFFEYFEDFDWKMWAITVNGPVSAETLEDDLQICDHIRVPVELTCVTPAADVESTEVDSVDDIMKSEMLPEESPFEEKKLKNEYKLKRVGFIPYLVLNMYR